MANSTAIGQVGDWVQLPSLNNSKASANSLQSFQGSEKKQRSKKAYSAHKTKKAERVAVQKSIAKPPYSFREEKTSISAVALCNRFIDMIKQSQASLNAVSLYAMHPRAGIPASIFSRRNRQDSDITEMKPFPSGKSIASHQDRGDRQSSACDTLFSDQSVLTAPDIMNNHFPGLSFSLTPSIMEPTPSVFSIREMENKENVSDTNHIDWLTGIPRTDDNCATENEISGSLWSIYAENLNDLDPTTKDKDGCLGQQIPVIVNTSDDIIANANVQTVATNRVNNGDDINGIDRLNTHTYMSVSQPIMNNRKSKIPPIRSFPQLKYPEPVVNEPGTSNEYLDSQSTEIPFSQYPCVKTDKNLITTHYTSRTSSESTKKSAQLPHIETTAPSVTAQYNPTVVDKSSGHVPQKTCISSEDLTDNRKPIYVKVSATLFDHEEQLRSITGPSTVNEFSSESGSAQSLTHHMADRFALLDDYEANNECIYFNKDILQLSAITANTENTITESLYTGTDVHGLISDNHSRKSQLKSGKKSVYTVLTEADASKVVEDMLQSSTIGGTTDNIVTDSLYTGTGVHGLLSDNHSLNSQHKSGKKSANTLLTDADASKDTIFFTEDVPRCSTSDVNTVNAVTANVYSGTDVHSLLSDSHSRKSHLKSSKKSATTLLTEVDATKDTIFFTDIPRCSTSDVNTVNAITANVYSGTDVHSLLSDSYCGNSHFKIDKKSANSLLAEVDASNDTIFFTEDIPQCSTSDVNTVNAITANVYSGTDVHSLLSDSHSRKSHLKSGKKTVNTLLNEAHASKDTYFFTEDMPQHLASDMNTINAATANMYSGTDNCSRKSHGKKSVRMATDSVITLADASPLSDEKQHILLTRDMPHVAFGDNNCTERLVTTNLYPATVAYSLLSKDDTDTQIAGDESMFTPSKSSISKNESAPVTSNLNKNTSRKERCSKDMAVNKCMDPPADKDNAITSSTDLAITPSIVSFTTMREYKSDLSLSQNVPADTNHLMVVANSKCNNSKSERGRKRRQKRTSECNTKSDKADHRSNITNANQKNYNKS